MENQIEKLDPKDFKRCGNIWDMEKNAGLADRFYRELSDGNRVTYVYMEGDDFVGEVSIVFDMDDPDYTVEGRRVYMSRLIVKREWRRRGIGRKLVDFAVDRAGELGYNEITVGVDIDNYAALRLYVEAGFDSIVYVGEDEGGRFLKLLRRL